MSAVTIDILPGNKDRQSVETLVRAIPIAHFHGQNPLAMTTSMYCIGVGYPRALSGISPRFGACSNEILNTTYHAGKSTFCQVSDDEVRLNNFEATFQSNTIGQMNRIAVLAGTLLLLALALLTACRGGAQRVVEKEGVQVAKGGAQIAREGAEFAAAEFRKVLGELRKPGTTKKEALDLEQEALREFDTAEFSHSEEREKLKEEFTHSVHHVVDKAFRDSNILSPRDNQCLESRPTDGSLTDVMRVLDDCFDATAR